MKATTYIFFVKVKKSSPVPYLCDEREIEQEVRAQSLGAAIATLAKGMRDLARGWAWDGRAYVSRDGRSFHNLGAVV